MLNKANNTRLISVYTCRSSDNEDIDDVVARRVSSGDAARVSRKAVQLYRRGKMNNNQDSSDDSDSVLSLHRNAFNRRNMLIWRDHHWQPESVGGRFDTNNNEGSYMPLCTVAVQTDTFVVLNIKRLTSLCLQFSI